MPQLTLPSIKQKKTLKPLLPSMQALFTTWLRARAAHSPLYTIFPLIMYSTAKAKRPYRETDYTNPRSTYGQSKVAGELFGFSRASGKYNCPYFMAV